MKIIENTFFSELPKKLQEHLAPHMKLVELKRGAVIPVEGDKGKIIFPLTCVIAMSASCGEKPGAFLFFAGQGYVLGFVSRLKIRGIQLEACVCEPGHAYVLPASLLNQCLPKFIEMDLMSILVCSAIAEEASHAAYCLQSHAGEQRVARVILEISDTCTSKNVVTTSHGKIAELLGVRRETVTGIISKWRKLGIVDVKRNRMTIEKKNVLKQIACECYDRTKESQRKKINVWRAVNWSDL